MSSGPHHVDGALPSGRQRHRRTAARALVVGVLTALVVVGSACTSTGGGKPHKTSASHVSPQFAENRSTIEGYVDAKGLKYTMRGDPGNTKLVLRDGRIVRGNPENSGSTGAPIAVIANRSDPKTVGLSFVFTAGSTDGQNAVVGACQKSFAAGSIQLGVYPTSWKLFWTLKRTNAPGTQIVTIAQGGIGPLKTDGATVYDSSMTADLATSSVTIRVPGVTKTVSDPHIAQLWGTYAGIQIRHPRATDGDVEITGVTVSLN